MHKTHADHHIIHVIIAQAFLEALSNLRITSPYDRSLFIDGMIRQHMLMNIAKRNNEKGK